MYTDELIKLKNWFLLQRRELPWRDDPTPYAVWISEIMLQQTQVAVVIPYFERWMKRFPTIQDLASASLDEVLKYWEGLGYYARARNLHTGACYVLKHFAGNLPSNEGHLREIKGLGDYTIGAILSFAFHQRKAAIDGNVLRVLTRYYTINDDISKTKTKKKINDIVEDFLPMKEPWVISEALIELGATICKKIPKCEECCLKNSCKAFNNGLTAALPVKSKSIKAKYLFRAVAVIYCQNQLLVRRGVQGKVMAGLYEFPYFELSESKLEVRWLEETIKNEFNLISVWKQGLEEVQHSFTKYHAYLFPQLFLSKNKPKVLDYEWLSLDNLDKLAFSSGHRRIFNEIRNLL